MKNLFKNLVAILVVVFMVSMSSCGVNKNIVIPTMRATVDSAAWNSIFRLTVVKQDSDPKIITITGTPTVNQTADKTIIITVRGIEAKEYKLSATGAKAECAIVYKIKADAAEGGDDYYVSYNATVKITKIDLTKKQLSGTFSCSLVPSSKPLGTKLHITNGTFENLNLIPLKNFFS